MLSCTPAPRICVPGRQVACECPTGTGFKVCDGSGVDYEPCRCPASNGGGGGGAGGGGGSGFGGGSGGGFSSGTSGGSGGFTGTGGASGGGICNVPPQCTECNARPQPPMTACIAGVSTDGGDVMVAFSGTVTVRLGARDGGCLSELIAQQPGLASGVVSLLLTEPDGGERDVEYLSPADAGPPIADGETISVQLSRNGLLSESISFVVRRGAEEVVSQHSRWRMPLIGAVVTPLPVLRGAWVCSQGFACASPYRDFDLIVIRDGGSSVVPNRSVTEVGEWLVAFGGAPEENCSELPPATLGFFRLR